jgi:hypothetical protein
MESKRVSYKDKHIDKIVRSVYTSFKGKPDHPGKGVS